MATIVVRAKTSFRRGLGAASFLPTGWGGQPPIFRGGGNTVAPPSSATSTNTATGATSTTSSGFPGRNGRGRQPSATSQGYVGGTPSGSTRWSQSSGGQYGTQTASQSTMAAFNAALSQAVSYGVISTTGAASLQAQANGASDATVQALTAQINQLLATTPSAALTAAGASTSTATPTTATASTSWWSGSTTLLGATVSNSTLAIGAGLAAVALWAAFKKK